MIDQPNPHDWPEDEKQYSHTCACDQSFGGAKQRRVCKACTLDNMDEKVKELTRQLQCKDAEMSELIYKHNAVVEYLERKIR